MATKKLHLPDLVYGGPDAIADVVDEAGSEIAIGDLSGAVVGLARAVASNLRTLDKLAQRLDAIDGRIVSLVGIHQQQAKVNESGTRVADAVEASLRASLARANDRVTDLETRIAQLERVQR